jgi:serine/threonine protein phosphatase PrpC
MLVEESEITETEDDDDVSDIFGPGRRRRKKIGINDPHHNEGGFIPTPAGCKCHYYRPHDAMLYTAHVGDCRAVMLGSAPPRTIKVPPEGDSSHSMGHADMSEDESSSSVSIADEISSSDHDSDSSEEGCEDDEHFMTRGTPPSGTAGTASYMRYVSAKRQRRGEKNDMIDQPFVPLPPINRCESSSSEESAVESDDSASTTAQEHQPPVSAIRSRVRTRVDIPYSKLENEKMLEPSGLETEDEEGEDEIKEEIRSVRSGSPTQMDRPPSPTQLVADPPDHPPPLPLSMLMRPIDLTTDHSAYNPAEVTAVLRRCNNAPKAISSASGGGIKRVAGSLAVTRALGDAYLKTPRLSFFPYKRHAPYITARPEVNCRIITKGADRILILASDGVWERASGDDVLRWVRSYYNARIAGVKESNFHTMYDMDIGEEAEHSFGDSAKRMSRRKVGGSSDGISSVKTNVAMEKEPFFTSPPDDSTIATNTPPHISTGGTDDSKEDGATASETTSATTTTADEIAAVGSKRKHLGSGSISTRSSNGSLALEGRENRKGRHHSSRSFSLGIPTVSDVIVRKVLNKVRKTRNISSLRMLMSLPKGRARRSKHDDITATVVDLSVSL